MISEYHRPETISEALALLARPGMPTVPMGGGTGLDRSSTTPVAVVDLQALSLYFLNARGNKMELGATVSLQTLLEDERLPSALQAAIRHEAAYHIRQVATLAGSLVSADGRSPFSTVMLAMDAELIYQPGEDGEEGRLSLGDLFSLRGESLRGRLITQATIPLNARQAYTYVARTPADLPIVCAAVARWPSGRTRVCLGGYGSAPRLVMDGEDSSGAELAACNAYSQAEDEWASAEYRQEVAGILVRRCVEAIMEK
ncbi:MAG TPA: FAD binding domain-containing protein [Anaerolineales bacterium]|nr:FAD binding domain-containing protein [Anaerolineales bacterium]